MIKDINFSLPAEKIGLDHVVFLDQLRPDSLAEIASYLSIMMRYLSLISLAL